MLPMILLALAAIIVVFAVVVALQPAEFRMRGQRPSLLLRRRLSPR